MKKHYLIQLFIACLISISVFAESDIITLSDGIYFKDGSQKELYTGDYKELYPDGSLKLEMRIKNGQIEGTYVTYFPNGNVKEVRSYLDGQLHGTWRTYNSDAILTAEAIYSHGKKNYLRIWDDSGKLRYQMNFINNKK